MSNEDIICPLSGKCTSFPSFCLTCKKNKGKRDYYVPAKPTIWTYPYTTTYTYAPTLNSATGMGT
jgi:hypothetical protein